MESGSLSTQTTEVVQPLAGAGRSYLAAILAWAFPGAGHFFLGRRGRGCAFFVLVLFSLALGSQLDGPLYRDLNGPPLTIFATLGAMGAGVPYFVLRGPLDYKGNPEAPGYEYGKAFLLTAGLMNLLLILDAWDIARGRKT